MEVERETGDAPRVPRVLRRRVGPRARRLPHPSRDAPRPGPGETLGPAIGGLLLQTAPDAVWWGGALAAVLAGAVLLRLGGRIPEPLREAQSRLASAPEAA